jgi:TRAP-type transport system small permease protein
VRIVNLIGNLVTWMDKLLKAVISAMVGIMLAVIVLQVFCRYVLNAALSWPEELSRYLMIWSGLLAAIYAYHEGSHVGVTFLLERLNRTAAKVIAVASNIFMGIFLAVVAWQGILLLSKFQDLKSSALQIPMSLVYAAVPVSSVLMLLVCLRLIYGVITENPTREE